MAIGEPESIRFKSTPADQKPIGLAIHGHYAECGIQPEEYCRANMPVDELRGAYKYNILKYLERYPRKGGVDDLRKMLVYVNWLIELETENG